MTTPFWSVHTHSRYSAKDAMRTVPALVEQAHILGYPALGLTDHGNISGAVQLYKNCRRRGMEPLPGVELYLTPDRERGIRSNYHLTVLAYSEVGYRNLVRLNNMAARNFYFRPRVDLADLADLADSGHTRGLMVATGCYFGLVQQTLEKRGFAAAKQLVAALAGWFPRTYVELHNHGVTHENGLTDEDHVYDLLAIAEQLGLPFLIAQDSHYLTADEQPVHDGLKTLVSFSDDPSEAVFPGGPYHLADRDFLAGFYPQDVLDEACGHLAELAQAASVRLPELETFSMKVPDVTHGGDPMQVLRDKMAAYAEAQGWLVTKPSAEAKFKLARFAEELGVIEAGEMPGYLLLVAEVCDFMRSRKISFHARGSASSSAVCYALGITQVDPFRWKLLLDRFLSSDRTRPGDIDLDIEHTRRDEVVTWMESRWSVRQVGSHMQLGLQDDAESDDGGSKGSLLKLYFWSLGKTREKFQKRTGLPAADRPIPSTGRVEQTWDDIPPESQRLLKKLADSKLISGPGTHAAGYIVAPDEAAVSQLPLNWMPRSGKDGGFVTAYGKKDVEALGFLKLDLLGLKTRTAIKLCCQMITEPDGPGPHMDPEEFEESIPENDAATYKRIGRGDTEGMFQLEGFAQMRGCRDLRPKTLEDIALAQALFRPAALKSKDTEKFLARRKKIQPVPERHPDIMEETADTYGIALYQEQVMGLCKRIGMSSEELTDTLDAVKASNEATIEAKVYLERIRERVGELATARGWSADDVQWLVGSLAGYAEYSFNKAHAASYGTIAYRTGYLAEHYPLEFWTAMLIAYTGAKRGKQSVEAIYVRAARKYNLKVLPAHVNLSQAGYSLDRKQKIIRRGLICVHNVGARAASEIAAAAPYVSLADMGQRLPTRVGGAKNLALKKPPNECGGQIAALHEAGALIGLEVE